MKQMKVSKKTLDYYLDKLNAKWTLVGIIALGFITAIFIPAKRIEFIRLRNLKADSK